MNTTNNLIDFEDEIIEQDDGDDDDSGIYPVDRDKIQVIVHTMTTFTMSELIKKWDIIPQPDFQRLYVWTDEKAEKLIDSIWNGLPIPQIFLLIQEDGIQITIDWQQRLTTLMRFMLSEEKLHEVFPQADEEFSLKVSKRIFTWKDEDKDEKVSFFDLSIDIRRKFENESITITQIRPNYSLLKDGKSSLEHLSKEIFLRLNTGWIQLTEQEIRNSLYHKEFMKKIKEISFEDRWKKLFPVNIAKFKNEPSLFTEILLRASAFLDTYANEEDFDTIWKIEWFKYEKPLSLFLDRYASHTNNFNDNYINDRISLFNKVIDRLENYDDWNLFRHEIDDVSKNFNIKYIDTIFVGILNLMRYYPNITKEELDDKINEFKNNEEFIRSHITKAWWSTDPWYIQDRVIWAMNFFNNNQ